MHLCFFPNSMTVNLSRLVLTALVRLSTFFVVSNTDGTILAQAMSPEALHRCTARDHVSSELCTQIR